MKTLVLKPAVEQIKGGWVGKAHLYEDSVVPVSGEVFNAYDDKQETWDNLLKSAQQFADNHNQTCQCGIKMVVGSY
jgi:hypothetical protein